MAPYSVFKCNSFLFLIGFVGILLINFSSFSTSAPTEDVANLDSKDDIPDPHLNVTLSDNPNDVHFYFFPKLQEVATPGFEEIMYNDVTSLKNSGFVAHRPTVFIIHGFRSNLYSGMPQTVKNAFLASNLNYNIIVLDWGKLATPQPPLLTGMLYALVTRFSVPIVGQRIADFIMFLREQGVLSLNQVYLVGHSLGAHLSGIAGSTIFNSTGEKILRITGLDPAGPHFFPHMPERNLMKDDALFVDVIHTNMGTLGDMTSDGVADFFPNGGSEQPNCHEADTASPFYLGTCSHAFSFQLYAASLTKSFPACSCPNYLFTQTLGNCSATCDNPVLLGYPAPSTSPNGDYYLETTNPP